MPHSRVFVFVLLTLAIAGAAWLWWSTSNGDLTSIQPTEASSQDIDPAGVTIDGAADSETSSGKDAAAVERTKATAMPSSMSPGQLRVTATWPDHAPAAEVMVYLRQSVPRLPYTAFARGVTDADGIVVFTDLPRGPSTLASDRGDRQEVTVEGGPQEVTFELEGGVAVRGTVLNPDGELVAGAGIWLQTSDTSWSGGHMTTFTNAAGEFALEHVSPEQSLGAVAAGFAPAKLVDLDIVDKSRPPAVVELILLPEGGRLQGTLTDRDGEAIAKATVAVGKRPRYLNREGERVIEEWTVRTAETDDKGFFQIVGLATGSHPVAIRAGGYGLWRSEVTLEAQGTSVISPVLELAARLSGIVTDAEGKPLEKASIRVYDREPRTPFLAGGQIDFDETFGYCAAVAGPDGKYRIEEVTAGTVYVFAQLQQDRRQWTGVSVAYTQAELQIAPDSEAQWDPVIDDGLAIEGVVLYADGFPIPNLFITLADEKGGGKQHVINSNREGVFRFLCLEDSTYEIRVQAPFYAPKDSAPIEKATGVLPNRGRTEFRATYNKPVKQENGIVVGRIDDVAGRIQNPMAATVTLHSDNRWFQPGIKIEDGAFRIDGIKPCRFRLILKEDETVLAETDWFELQSGATVDTGVLVTEPAGAAMISVKRGEGTASFEPKIYLRSTELGSSTMIPLGRRSEVQADNLTPGEYNITGSFKGMVRLKSEVKVVAGQTTPVKLSLQAGALLNCEVWWPAGETKTISRKIRILDSAGKLFYEYEGKLSTIPTRPHPLNYTLPPGHWKIEFSTDDGLRGQVEFEVTNTTDAVKARIDLK